MDRRFAIVLVIGCGGTTPPATTPAEPPPPPSVPLPTCAEVATILRGQAADAQEDEPLGAAYERALAESCTSAAWSAAVRECIGTVPDAHTCLDQLDAEQLAHLDEAKEIGDASAPEPSCIQAIGDLARYSPPVGPDAPEREWILAQRYRVLAQACEDGWSHATRVCLFGPDGEAPDPERCLELEVAAAERTALAEQLARLTTLAEGIAAARTKPRTLQCKNVVATHYATAKWKDKLDGFSAADRKKMIAASRQLMTSACTSERWDEFQRACIVVVGDATCFEPDGRAFTWGYPAVGAVGSLGIPECDAYDAAITRVTNCAALPAMTRAAMQRSVDEIKARLASLPVNERAVAASGCTTGREPALELAKSRGC